MTHPSISVIVIGHKRKDFILEALRSANDQSLKRDKYEVICVKNFRDELVDHEIEKYADFTITSKEENFGEKAFTALSISRGEIVCFLDDDDLFSNNKLKYVQELFSDQDRVDYYHNGRTTDISQFRDSGSKLFANKKRVVSLDLRVATQKDVFSFLQRYPDFNSSSISIRREIVDSRLESLKRMIMHPDTFFLLCALEGKGILVDDSSVLTFYRLHQSTTNHFEPSLTDFYESKFFYYSRTDPDWDILYSILKKPTNKLLCRCDALHNRLLKELYNREARKSHLFGISIEFAKCIRSRNLKNTFIILMLGFFMAVFPKLGRQLFFLFNTRLVPHA